MPTPEKNGALIALSEAKELIKNFNLKYPNEVKANLIDADLVKQLLEQDGCIGIRIYNGYNVTNEKLSPVLVGVDCDKNDITKGLLLDRLSPCPNNCSVNTELFD